MKIFSKRLFLTIVAIAVLVVTAKSLSLGRASADSEDVTPPALQTLSFDSNTFDTSAGSDTVTVTIEATDDLSGVSSVMMRYTPLNSETPEIDAFFELESGDAMSGTYTGVFTFPQYSASGVWKMYYLKLIDDIGNEIEFDEEALEEYLEAEAGAFRLTNSSEVDDTTAPTLVSITIREGDEEIDTENGSAEVQFTIVAEDDLTGISDNGDQGMFARIVPENDEYIGQEKDLVFAVVSTDDFHHHIIPVFCDYRVASRVLSLTLANCIGREW